MNTLSTKNPPSNPEGFIEGYLRLRQEGIRRGSGNSLQDYIDERVKLIKRIPWDDPKRLPNILFVLNQTKRPKILRAAIEKLDLNEPEEFSTAYDLLSSKSSNSKEKNEEIEEARDLLVVGMIAKNNKIIEFSNSLCGHISKFQRSLEHILETNISDILFQTVIAERSFQNLEVFEEFYVKLLGRKIYPPDLAENRRKYIIQRYLPSNTDKEFKTKAFSSAFILENSVMMLLRIKMMAAEEAIMLVLPKTCLNLRVLFTEEQIEIVRKEMNEKKELEQNSTETDPFEIQAQTELEEIISRKACSASILLAENPSAKKEIIDLDAIFARLTRELEEKKLIER